MVKAHTLVGVQHQRWTVVIQRRRHGDEVLSRNGMTWRPVTNNRQHRAPARLPKAFLEGSGLIRFFEVDKTSADIFGILPRFLENLQYSKHMCGLLCYVQDENSTGRHLLICPHTFLAYLVVLCFERRCPKQNTVARWKSKYLPPKHFGLATPLDIIQLIGSIISLHPF